MCLRNQKKSELVSFFYLLYNQLDETSFFFSRKNTESLMVDELTACTEINVFDKTFKIP